MKSLQHVFWRGALALSLMAVGVGSGIALPPAPSVADTGNACAEQARILVVRGGAAVLAERADASAIVIRRARSPMASDS